MKRHYIGMAMIAASVLVTMMLMGCEAPAVEAETAAAVKEVVEATQAAVMAAITASVAVSAATSAAT